MATFWQIIKEFFIGKKKEEFITKLPHPLYLEKVGKYINKKFAEQNAELRARLLKQQAELDRLKKSKSKEREKEERALVEEIIKQKKKAKKEEKEKSLKLLFPKEVEPPKLTLKNNRIYGRLLGFYLKETDSGHTLWYPYIQYSRGIGIPRGGYAFNFGDIFKETINIPSQIKSGKVSTNFMINKKATGLILVNPETIAEDVDTGEKYKIKDISQQERAEYEQRIQEIMEKLKKIAGALEQVKEREIEYQAEIAESKIEVKTASKERDAIAARFSNLSERQVGLIKTATDSLVALQDAYGSSLLEKRENISLRETLTTLRNKMETMETLLPDEKARIQYRQAMMDVNQMLKSLGPMPPPEAPVKEEPK